MPQIETGARGHALLMYDLHKLENILYETHTKATSCNPREALSSAVTLYMLCFINKHDKAGEQHKQKAEKNGLRVSGLCHNRFTHAACSERLH